MEINLKTFTQNLIKTDEELTVAESELMKLDLEYQETFDRFYLTSGMATAPLKHAEAMEKLRLEPVYDKYHEMLLKTKILTRRYRTYQTVCSNIKSVAWGDY